MAAAIEGRTADADGWSKASRIAAIDIVHDLAAAESIWRKLEGAQTSFTPYQRFDFLSPWQRQVGEREGLAPFIVIAYDAERRPLLCCRQTRARHGARCAGFMGGIPPSTWRCSTAISPQRNAGRSQGSISAISQRSEADVHTASAIASWRDLPNPPPCCRIAPANDCPLCDGAGCGAQHWSATRPGRALGQGAQAAVPARLSQSRRNV
jgi:hypothetical protein